MSPQQRVRFSKFLSLVLRHQPQAAQVTMDEAGWVEIEPLLLGCRAQGWDVSAQDLEEVVRASDKQRFVFSADRTAIRAQQGHSVTIQLGYEPASPPELLFHGTVSRYLPAIRKEGLRRGSRTHVHLSETVSTAEAVGRRRGSPVIVTVHAGRMAAAGYSFFQSPNGVWLTDAVPPGFLDVPQGDESHPGSRSKP